MPPRLPCDGRSPKQTVFQSFSRASRTGALRSKVLLRKDSPLGSYSWSPSRVGVCLRSNEPSQPGRTARPASSRRLTKKKAAEAPRGLGRSTREHLRRGTVRRDCAYFRDRDGELFPPPKW